MPSPCSRRTKHLDFEPLATAPRDVVDTNTAKNPSFRSRRQKARIEQLGLDYLQGKPLFILSATLRGPFDSAWVNPWLDRRKESRSKARSLPWQQEKPRHRSTQDVIELESPPRKKPRHLAEQDEPPSHILQAADPNPQCQPEDPMAQTGQCLSNSENHLSNEDFFASPRHNRKFNHSSPYQFRSPEAKNNNIEYTFSTTGRRKEEKEAGHIHSEDSVPKGGLDNTGNLETSLDGEHSEQPRDQLDCLSLSIRSVRPRSHSDQLRHARVSRAILSDSILNLEKLVSSEALNLRGGPSQSLSKWLPDPDVHGDLRRDDFALSLATSPRAQRTLAWIKKTSRGTRRLIDFEALSPAINTKSKGLAPSSAPEPESFQVQRPTDNQGNRALVPDEDRSVAYPRVIMDIGKLKEQQTESPFPSTQLAMQEAHEAFQEGLRSPIKAPEVSKVAKASTFGPESSSEAEPKCEITPFQKIDWMNKMRGMLDGDGATINTQELFDAVSPFDVSTAKTRKMQRSSFSHSPISTGSIPAPQTAGLRTLSRAGNVERENSLGQTAQEAQDSAPDMDISEFVDEANSFLGNWDVEKAAKGTC